MSSPTLPPQYDLSPKEQRMVADRAKIRNAFRAEYIKQKTSPHVHGHGGYLFDPAMQRWMSMRAQQWYYFKPNPKTGIGAAFIVLSCFAYGHLFKVRRGNREKDYRAGLVSYRDRDYKFV